ncbi:MAG: DUF2865 domain-containing protein [Methyloceanibacter sp.]|uniref:DUF2865 domain-containing protein n=1 Tax=Methyloceanibacter sp. TaxID=1965321 RepID=UPI003D6D0EB9
MSATRHLRRVLPSSVRSLGRAGLIALALAALALPGEAVAQGLTEQQIRCMQLEQELAAARGGGANAGELARLEQQIAQHDRVFQGTQAAMEDAGCYERMFIFGRALKRSAQCLNMNNRVEDARRQLARLQEQRSALQRGGGNKRRQAELQQALARSGCGGAPRRGGGGLFDFFGGEREPEYQTPVYRSINPNGRYRTVCVRLCDGFYFPLHHSIYGSQVAQDAEQCQANCAAPAELYVYHNPGQEIEQAISLSGSAYMDLPVALKFRKEFVKGCSCKQVEYNPTEIEAANKKADATQATGATPAQAAAAPAAPAAPEGEVPQLDLDITGSAEPPAAAPAPPAEEVEAEIAPPPPLPAAEAPSPPSPPPAAEAQGQSTITKTKPQTSAN